MKKKVKEQKKVEAKDKDDISSPRRISRSKSHALAESRTTVGHSSSEEPDNSSRIQKKRKRRGSESHQPPDSDDNIDSEIGHLAKLSDSMITEEMSDFSVHSPKKRVKTSPRKSENNIIDSKEKNNESQKKMKNSEFDLNSTSSDMDASLSKAILSKSVKSSKGSKDKSATKRKGQMSTESVGQSNDDIITEQNLTLRYKKPEGFEPCKLMVSSSDLCKEDMDKKELWLIKAPIDFDIEQLNGASINLNGDSDLHTKDGEFYEISGSLDSNDQMSLFNAVLPSKEESTFVVGPQFKGQIHIMKSLDIPLLPSIQKRAPVIPEIPSDLKVRFQPFGSGTPYKSKKRLHIDNEDTGDYHEDLPSKRKEKKKKK